MSSMREMTMWGLTGLTATGGGGGLGIGDRIVGGVCLLSRLRLLQPPLRLRHRLLS
jgi:hypothetical protein